MIPIITFQEALEKSKEYAKRHLLLGNGFSIACIPSIFTYDSIYNQADFNSMPEVKKIFELFKTQDFELIINALEKSSRIVPVYEPENKELTAKMHLHSQNLKQLLIETLAQKHPAYPAQIEDYKYKSCLRFLAHFIDSNSCVYTLNYDLLLYWTLMHGLESKQLQMVPSDGFGKDTDFENGTVQVSDFVTWQGDSQAHGQNIHYLHGALHIYDRGADIEKFTWIGTGITLIDQATNALSKNLFPVFVAEGDSIKKMDKIVHCGYLYHSYKSFSANMKVGAKSVKNCLFTFGVSFSENDQHILKKISQGKVAHLFVSIYGDPASEANKQIINAAEGLKRRRKGNDLNITYYDAASAEVWN